MEEGKIYEFRKDGRLHTLVWKIWVDGVEVHTEAGTLGGQFQHTFDITKPVGKINTKAFVPAEEQALLVAERKITKKQDENYVEYINGKPKKQAVKAVDFMSLPPAFACFKPERQPDENTRTWKKLKDVLDHGEPILTIKRDGMMHFVLITLDRKVELYTRRMESCTDHYPSIVKSFESLKLPGGSVLACEFVVVDENGKDDRLAMQSLSRSLPERARALQEKINPIAVVLAPVFWKKEPVLRDWPVGRWMEFLDLTFSKLKVKNIKCIEIFFGSLKEADDYVQKHELEGLVIYDGNAIFGDKAFNFRGKPDRPDCWKHKPLYEDDFIIVFDPTGKFDWSEGGAFGKGKLKHSAGNVALYQFDKGNKLHFISNCGSGFTHAQLEDIPKAARMNGGRVGVAAIKFASRRYIRKGDKTNALVEPIFLYWHPDKKDHECINHAL